ncbi:zinc finger C-x8-C-x5-C-x3-H type family protein [Wolffia australiana]
MEEGAPGEDPISGLEETLWQLSLEYPQRPGERDCDFYIRTGTCGYGDKCRYNHPRTRSVGNAAAPAQTRDYPERVGQTVCQYFMKTGTCKFSPSCKYHHPRQRATAPPVQLNSFGYPLRPGEKDCSYYMKTGLCKFGPTCKFNHPELAGTTMAALSSGPTFFPAVQAQSTLSPSQFPPMASWQMSNPAHLLSTATYFPGPYGHTLFIPGMVPIGGWSPYPPSVNAGMVPGGGQHSLPSSSSASPSFSGQRENTFPERPGQPECQYYMRTGDCKYGSSCKFDHPVEKRMQKINYTLSPLGLPLRPGASACAFYMEHGHCKFGPSCKYDHPIGTLLEYSPAASSFSNYPPPSNSTGNISVPSTAQISAISLSRDQQTGFMPG